MSWEALLKIYKGASIQHMLQIASLRMQYIIDRTSQYIKAFSVKMPSESHSLCIPSLRSRSSDQNEELVKRSLFMKIRQSSKVLSL